MVTTSTIVNGRMVAYLLVGDRSVNNCTAENRAKQSEAGRRNGGWYPMRNELEQYL